MRAEVVLDAPEMAVGQRRPKGVIHHSDQGVAMRVAIYVFGLRQALQRGRRAPVHRLGR